VGIASVAQFAGKSWQMAERKLGNRIETVQKYRILTDAYFDDSKAGSSVKMGRTKPALLTLFHPRPMVRCGRP
jgi:hypothetical protein